MHLVTRFRRRELQETVFDRWLRSARDGLFGVLLTMSKGAHSHLRWSIFGMTWDFLQLLAYALYSHYFPWHDMPNMRWLVTFLLFVNPTSAALQVAPLAAAVLLFVACAWITATIVAAVWSAHSFSVGDFSTVLPLKFLRATGGLTVVLFVPVVGLLISTFKCKEGKYWSGTPWPCWGPGHFSVVIIVLVLLPAFWLFCIVVSAVFYDRNYRSDNITARAHARVAISMVTIKTGLTLVFTVASDLGPWFLVAVCLSCGCIWLYLWLRFLPAYEQNYNRALASFGAVFMWASLCTALSMLLENPEDGVAGWVFYVGAPTAAYAGYACAYLRWIGFSDRAPGMKGAVPGSGRLRSPYDVELRARCILRDVIVQERAEHSGAHSSAVTVQRISHPPRHHIDYDPNGGSAANGTHDDAGIVIGGDSAHEHRQEHHRRTSQARVSQVAPMVPGAIGGRRSSSGAADDTDDLGLLHAQAHPPHGHASSGNGGRRSIPAPERAALIASAAALLKAGCEAFPTAAIMDLMHANFIHIFIGDADAELECIAAGLAKEPTLDIRFLLMKCKQELIESGSAGVGVTVEGEHAVVAHNPHHQPHQQSIVEKVVYEKLVAESTEWSIKSRSLELAFWNELRRPQPLVTQLHRLSAGMSNAISRAESSFERLLAMRPDSLEAMESYAVFLLEVKRDTDAADAQFARADKLTRLNAERQQSSLKAGGSVKSQHDGHNVQRVSGPGDSTQKARAHTSDTVTRNSQVTMGDINVDAITFDQHRGIYGTAAAELVSSRTLDHMPNVRHQGGRRARGPAASVKADLQDRQHTGMSTASDFSVNSALSFHPHTPWHDPLIISPEPPAPALLDAPLELQIDEAQQQEGRQRRRSSLISPTARSLAAGGGVGVSSMLLAQRRLSAPGAPSTVHAASAMRRPSIEMPTYATQTVVSNPSNEIVPLSMRASGGRPPLLLDLSSRNHTVDSIGSLGAPKAHENNASLQLTGGAADEGSSKGLLAKKAHAVIAINRYADKAGRRRRSSLAAAAESQEAVERPRGLPISDAEIGGGSGSPEGSPIQRAALERAELGMSSHELAELERRRADRVAVAATNARRADANMRQDSSVESAAHALRRAINSREAGMDPVLVAVGRVFFIFFVAAALLNVVMVSLLSVRAAGLSSTVGAMRLSAQRSLYLESILHRTQQLILLNAGILPPTVMGSANLTSLAVIDLLRADASLLDGVHRALLGDVQAGSALPDEVALYADSVLPVRYLSSGAYAALAVSSKLASFGDLGLEIASSVALLVGNTLPRDVSASQPDVWFLLENGPGVVREACRRSTALLVQRADAQAAGILQASFGVSASGVLALSVLLALCLVPLALAFKQRSEHMFSIFLNMPDALVQDMQMECAGQLAELRSLFDDHETFSLLAGPVDSALLAKAAAVRESESAAFDTAVVVGGAQFDRVDRTDPVQRVQNAMPMTGIGAEVDEAVEGVSSNEISQSSDAEVQQNSSARMLLHPIRRPAASAPLFAAALSPVVEQQNDDEIATPLAAADTPTPTPNAHPPRSGSVRIIEAGGGVRAGLRISEPQWDGIIKEVEDEDDGGGSLVFAKPRARGTPSAASGADALSHLASKGSLLASRRNVRADVIAEIGEALVPSVRPPTGGALGLALRLGDASSMRRLSSLLSRDALQVGSPFASPVASASARAPSSAAHPPHLGNSGPDPVAQPTLHAARSFFARAPPPSLRSFRSSCKTSLALLVRFCWPALLLAAFYFGTYGYSSVTLTTLVTQRRLIATLSLLQVSLSPGDLVMLGVLSEGACPTTTVSLTPGAATIGSVVPRAPWMGAACDATAIQAAAAYIDSASTNITAFTDAFVYGDPQQATGVPAVAASAAAREIMMQDACVSATAQPDCRSFYHGVVKTGLLATLSTFVRKMNGALQVRLADLRSAARAGQPCPEVVLTQNGSASDAWVADQIASVYAQPALNALATEFQGTAKETIVAFVVGLAVIAVVAVALLAALYYVVLRRSIQRMDMDLKRTKATLLLFPSDVLASVAAFLCDAGCTDVLGLQVLARPHDAAV